MFTARFFITTFVTKTSFRKSAKTKRGTNYCQTISIQLRPGISKCRCKGGVTMEKGKCNAGNKNKNQHFFTRQDVLY